MNPPQITAAFEASRSRAHAALRAGQAATAERWLRELEAQRPGDIQCLWLLGVALLEQSRIEDKSPTSTPISKVGVADSRFSYHGCGFFALNRSSSASR